MARLTIARDPAPGPGAMVDLSGERRAGRLAGGCAALSIVAQIIAVPIAATGNMQRDGDEDLRYLLDVGTAESGHLWAAILRVVSTLLLIPVAYFLLGVVRRRQPAHSPWMLVVAVVSVVLTGASTLIGFLELREVAREFVASGPRTAQRAERMLDEGREGGLLRASNFAGLAGAVGLGVWTALTSRDMLRVGLLTRFLGLFGIAAGVLTAIGLPIASFLIMGWIASVAALALGYWPGGGRPMSWETGRAEDPDATAITGRPSQPAGGH